MNYPALYKSAEKLSGETQKLFYGALIGNLLALIAAAFISLVNSSEAWIAVVQAVTLLIALGSSIYIFSLKPERQWYEARAIAESIKTITWRYASKVHPYDHDDEIDGRQFLDTLKKLIDLNAAVAKKLSKYLGEALITREMQAIRELSLQKRISSYVQGRVQDQLTWYGNKSEANAKLAKRFFIALITANSIALLSSLLKIYCPSFQYWPIDVFVAIACSLLSWIQAKRYSENSTAYAIAAQEISIIKEQAFLVKDEKDFHEYVSNAENAFSREHTQWVAKLS